MATETNKTWGARSKKTSVVALGLVAILAGVAVAFFLTSKKFPNNRALGGTLTVDATLPLDFTGEELYPTTTTPTGPSDDKAAAEDSFDIDNNNEVTAKYELFATCEECIDDPVEKAACDATQPADDPTTPVDESQDPTLNDPNSQACQTYQARLNKINQWERLYVKIELVDPATRIGTTDVTVPTTGKRTQKYNGRLADLKPLAPADLGQIQPDGTALFEVTLWLDNDPNNAQPQAVTSIWEFFVNAKTPV